MEPEKPFACTLPDCGMTFTNEDHLHVHTKKHDMVLQLGMEQKAAFVADQTPTPTRFIRNCEEVGLFQDLQNVNPFDEGFKRAMETKHGILSLEAGSSSEDVLHTPHLVFPLEPGDCALYTANNQRNITISRSSSDESGAVKEYETTTISKLTNEVTTISRVVGKDGDRVTTTDDISVVQHGERARGQGGVNETSVSYTNNVIIHNVEIRKDETNRQDKLPPIMSQKSLDFVVDSLTTDASDDPKKREPKADEDMDDYEVLIKLPNGKHVKMKAVEDGAVQSNTKEKLRKALKCKSVRSALPKPVPVAIVQSVAPLAAGTLIPVTVLAPPLRRPSPAKIPIAPLPVHAGVATVKRVKPSGEVRRVSDACDSAEDSATKYSRRHLESRSAASKRYRERLKSAMLQQAREVRELRAANERLRADAALLRRALARHLARCPAADDLRNIQTKLENASKSLNEVNL